METARATPATSVFSTGVFVGVIGTLMIIAGSATTFLLFRRDRYDLDHWKLNVRMPVASMWMNIGYWKSPSGEPISHFDEACATLLCEVLSTAGILNSCTENSSKPRNLAVLDLGFGCGDQTWELSRLAKQSGWDGLRYVGLTLNPLQLLAASRRLDREITAAHADKQDPSSVALFHADGAKPALWPTKVKCAVESLTDATFNERWLLALDCLYHFSPSRMPVLRYAAGELGANLMAFDLILNQDAPRWSRLLARTISVLMECPWKAFLTEDHYRSQLVACGFDSETLVIRDVSKNVFPGLVDYLNRQDRALAEYGISFGGFKLVRKVFGWFGGTGLIRAVIVVARHGAER